MIGILYYSAPLLFVGGIASLLYPDEPAAVLSAQAGFVVVELLAVAIADVLTRRNGRLADGPRTRPQVEERWSVETIAGDVGRVEGY
jgi:hypothetical protein